MAISAEILNPTKKEKAKNIITYMFGFPLLLQNWGFV